MNGKKKALLIAVIAVLVLEAIGIAGYFWYSNLPQTKFRRQLSLGNKYLNGQDYESAVTAFENALAIEPKNEDAVRGVVRAYCGIGENATEPGSAMDAYRKALSYDSVNVKAYTGIAKAYEDQEDFDSEVDLLKTAYDATGDTSFIDLLRDLGRKMADAYEQKGDLKNEYAILKKIAGLTDDNTLLNYFFSGSQAFLDRLTKACETGDEAAIIELLKSDEYKKLAERQEINGDNLRMESNGKLIGIYQVSVPGTYGSSMVYIGDYTGDKREGNGYWFGYKDGNHVYSYGAWSGDSPNGSFTVREWNEGLDSRVVTRVITGPVANGLWDGSVSWGFEQADGFVAWPVGFTAGTVVSLGADQEGNGGVIVSHAPSENNTARHSGDLVFNEPGLSYGVPGFAQNES